MRSIQTIMKLFFWGGWLLLFLAACTAEPESAATATPTNPSPTEAIPAATATTVATATLPATPTTVSPSPTAPPPPAEEPEPTKTVGRSLWLSAVSAVPIYDGPAETNTQVGTLRSGEAVIVIGNIQDDWFPVRCPEGIDGRCWIYWDYNSLYSYEGTEPLVLTIPDPAGLAVESTNTTLSPDGRWQVESSRSETAWLAGESAGFFFVKTIVQSLDDGRTYTLVSKWHAAGLGEEGPPGVFHWSADGLYLYYTRTFDYHGVMCALYVNIGDNLERLDLRDGSTASFLPPLPRGLLTISPDELWVAYLTDDSLIVRDLAAAFSQDDQNSIKWQIPIDQVEPDPVSEITWSPDAGQVLVQTTSLADDCQLIGRSTWVLDIESGSFTLESTSS